MSLARRPLRVSPARAWRSRRLPGASGLGAGCLELVAVQLHVGCKRALWPVKERGKHLPRLVAVVVDRLCRERTGVEQGLGSGEGGGRQRAAPACPG